jgi:hypothetical protein
LHDQHRAGRWRNRCLPTKKTGKNLGKFAERAIKYRKDLVSTTEQIKAIVTRETGKEVSNLGDTNHLKAKAEMIHPARTKQEDFF